jgi:hypothetical protein
MRYCNDFFFSSQVNMLVRHGISLPGHEVVSSLL